MRTLVSLLILSAAVLAQPIRYEVRHIEQKLAGCDNEQDGCATLSFNSSKSLAVLTPPATASTWQLNTTWFPPRSTTKTKN